MRSQIAFVACLLALAGCGGGGGGSSAPPPVAPSPPPAIPPPPPPVIGADGGTVSEAGGAKVSFPAGAVSADTTFRIATDSTGAPPLPAGFKAAGNIYAITPHGGDFAQPVEVSIPAPNVTLLPNQELKLAKAEPNGEWAILVDSRVVDGKLVASVRSFSYFSGVVVTYPRSLTELGPYRYSVTADCGEQACDHLAGPATVTFTVSGNGGQLPSDCDALSELISVRRWGYGTANYLTAPDRFPLAGTTVIQTFTAGQYDWYRLTALLGCHHPDAPSNQRQLWGNEIYAELQWPARLTTYPAVSVVATPARLDVVEGSQANLDVLVAGGAFRKSPALAPSSSDHAIVDWLRSDNGGVSWRPIAQSFQHEANPLPFGTGDSWMPWSVRHSFVATAADQGALIRVNACYTPPAPIAAPPCVAGPATRINVLQLSALPAILDPPRSLLIRTAQTANFSVRVSGAPAPTLQWQTRPANSTGDWSNVTLGSGATTTNYTTATRTPAENGEQYRVVVSNALGSTASSAVTLSVSDLDVAPSITTQPASLNVTSGNDAVFAVAAYGTEAMSYQWRFNGKDIAGANSPVLRLGGVTAADAGSYSVAITNTAGSANSNAATLKVSAGTAALIAPSIVTQPAAVTVNVGNTATFAVGVDGTGPFSFQWRRDGANVVGATSASLTFNSAALPNAGSYSVVVTNSAGSVTSNAVTLDVQAAVTGTPPTITSQPSPVIVPAGGSATLAVGATGSGPLAYQWSIDGTAIPGATLPVLTLSNVDNSSVGNYTVSVTNNLSSVTSQAAALILLGAPVIQQDPAAVTAQEGGTATFSVAADGSGLHYQWLRNGAQIPGANDSSYTTPPLVAANSGAVYSVLVYNGAGLVTSQGAVLNVQVIVAPTVAQQPSNVSVQIGGTAQLCAAFNGTVPIMLHVQRWDSSAWTSLIDIPTNTNDAFCFPWTDLRQSDDGTQFRFVAQNAAGTATSNVMTVTVTSPAITTTTLVSVELDGGEPDYFSRLPSMSANGRLVAFTSQGTGLIAGGTNTNNNAYLRDLATGTTTLINRNVNGDVANAGVVNLKVSANGRYALFSSLASDLVADDTNGSLDVFRRDLQTGTTVRVNVTDTGHEADGTGNGNYDAMLDISADGRWVMFRSGNNVAAGGDGGVSDGYYLYLRDMDGGLTRYVAGTQANPVAYAALSDDGGWLAYGLNTVTPDRQYLTLYEVASNQYRNIFSFDLPDGYTSLREGMDISANGIYVAFALNAPSVTASTATQVMVIDRNNPGVATLVSTGANGTGDDTSAAPQISSDGRYVLFESMAPNLTGGLGLPWRRYAVVRDLVAGTTKIAAHNLDGTPASLSTNDYGTAHAISGDGSTVAFVTAQVYAEPR